MRKTNYATEFTPKTNSQSKTIKMSKAAALNPALKYKPLNELFASVQGSPSPQLSRFKHPSTRNLVPRSFEFAVKTQDYSRKAFNVSQKTSEPRGDIWVNDMNPQSEREQALIEKYKNKAKALLQDPERAPEEIARVFEDLFGELSVLLPAFSSLFDTMKSLALMVKNSRKSLAGETTTEGEETPVPQSAQQFLVNHKKVNKHGKVIRFGKSSTQELVAKPTFFHKRVSMAPNQSTWLYYYAI
eukprot:TRINITY_DN4271_c0_g2_i1.p1 TRINITY_DN4271_c0_g2~~TRINITY_DN4271_c0_g2_i1.p1  ORF type:complete len:243 (-),score=11.23 TRINITY_DN4271_c0_g2_i1:88-816(-)